MYGKLVETVTAALHLCKCLHLPNCRLFPLCSQNSIVKLLLVFPSLQMEEGILESLFLFISGTFKILLMDSNLGTTLGHTQANWLLVVLGCEFRLSLPWCLGPPDRPVVLKALLSFPWWCSGRHVVLECVLGMVHARHPLDSPQYSPSPWGFRKMAHPAWCWRDLGTQSLKLSCLQISSSRSDHGTNLCSFALQCQPLDSKGSFLQHPPWPRWWLKGREHPSASWRLSGHPQLSPCWQRFRDRRIAKKWRLWGKQALF